MVSPKLLISMALEGQVQYLYEKFMRILDQNSIISMCISDNRLTYCRQKFEEEILIEKQEPKCRIWNGEDVEIRTNQLSDLRGNSHG